MRTLAMHRQRGFLLVEALVGILIFSLGILGMVSLASRSIESESDARYRSEAASYTRQIQQKMWLSVNRTNADTVKASLLTFAHHPGGSASSDTCAFTGSDSTNPAVDIWAASAKKLPGAGLGSMQQIIVDTTGSANKVTVTVCWKAPSDTTMHRHTLVFFVNAAPL